MNSKERTVILFLCITLFIGASVSFLRNHQVKKSLKVIEDRRSDNDVTIQHNQNYAIVDNNIHSKGSNIININTASKRELEALSGIGPVLAQRIIDYREKNGGFKSKEELLKISGIGPKKFTAIKDKIRI